jgi:moderate conductance mechanosensitive channel
MPPNWPELTLALALALAAAYIVADLAARGVQAALGSFHADDRLRHYIERPRQLVRLVVFVAAAAVLAFPALRFAGYETDLGRDPDAIVRWLLSSGLRIALIAVAGFLVIRMGSAAARRFELEMATGTGLDVLERTKRANTLSQLLQKTLTTVVTAIGLLMVLRELQVDITPVLAGAGIVGLAVGFGAQTLVRDIISGFFLIVEDQVRVGDVAIVNGQGGLVEQINPRTIVLRDFEGAVHVVPNGEIRTLSNRTKDFSFYVIDLGMAYGEDPDRVAAAVRDAAATLMDDPQFGPHILEPVEIIGVDDFADSQVTLRLRIKTVPLKQWVVGRELRKRIARVLQERRIEIPFPQRTIWIREVPKVELSQIHPGRDASPGGFPSSGS